MAAEKGEKQEEITRDGHGAAERQPRRKERNTTDGHKMNTDFTEANEGNEEAPAGQKNQATRLYRRDAKSAEKRRDGRRDGERLTAEDAKYAEVWVRN